VGRDGEVGSCAWRISGECDVGCWRKGMGEGRVEDAGVWRSFDCECDECRRCVLLMLPTRGRLPSACSSEFGLSGRLSGGELCAGIEKRLCECGEVTETDILPELPFEP